MVQHASDLHEGIRLPSRPRPVLRLRDNDVEQHRRKPRRGTPLLKMTGALGATMGRRVVVAASLAHAMTHALELTFAALLVRLGVEFGADIAVLGAVAYAGTVTFGVAALPAGWLIDRYGARSVIIASMWIAGVFALVVAVSPSLPFLAVALTCLGAGIGLYHPAGTSMVATVAERRGLALAIQGLAGNLGIAAAPAVALTIAIVFDWRVAYAVFGIAAFGIGVLVWRIAPSQAEAIAAVKARVERGAFGGPVRVRTRPPAIRHWMTPALLIIYLSAVLQGFIYRGSLTFLTLHLRDHLGINLFGWEPDAVAGTAATVVLLAAVFGQIAGGTLSDRIMLERALLPFILLSIPLLALIGWSSGIVLLLAAAGFVVVNFAQQPIFNGLITDYSPPGAMGRAFGMSFFLTFGVGAIAAWLAGLLANVWGTPAVFYALAVVALAMMLAMSVVALSAERRRHAAERTEAVAHAR
ncbi:MAG: MFS transporter [Chloroflexi bacterium]|nr:MFS transporter [Chloroflexota bacterium]